MTATDLQAVTTTGIYCRAGCVARPLPENVEPYASAVAAEAAGFRPCLRCRPDRLPERSPSVPPAVAQALVLISEGYLDQHDEARLADRVGYSSRQLRRLFTHHVGASPDFVARSRRAHFARRLLDETDLTINDIAFASGFSSVRQMNRVVREVFAFTPSALRDRRRRGDVLSTDGGLRLRVPHGAGLPVASMIAYLGSRAIPGVEAVSTRGYRRTIMSCGHPGVIEIEPGRDHLDVVAHLPTFASVIDDVSRVRALFAVGEDPAHDAAQLADDPVIGPSFRAQPNLRLPGSWDRFETAVRVVVGQQVSVAGASTLTGRVAHRRGAAIEIGDPLLDCVFPAPEALVDADLTGLGLTGQRVATIRAVAEAVVHGDVDLLLRGDLDAIVDQWTALPGIGPWTAQVLAARVHRHPDAFPASDLGLRRAAGHRVGAAGDLGPHDLQALAEQWRPYRATAAAHLWFSEYGSEDGKDRL